MYQKKKEFTIISLIKKKIDSWNQYWFQHTLIFRNSLTLLFRNAIILQYLRWTCILTFSLFFLTFSQISILKSTVTYYAD